MCALQGLHGALIKVSAVATDIMGVSRRAMIEALIAGRHCQLEAMWTFC